MNTAKEMARFNATNVTGMKEIMVKAHALAKLTRIPTETYANAFRRCLKLVWRKIKRADTMNHHVYLYATGNKEHPYDFVHTAVPYLYAVDYFNWLLECENRKSSALDDIQNDTFYADNTSTKEELTNIVIDYIDSFLPQLKILARYDNELGYAGYHNRDSEIKRFVSDNFYRMKHDFKTLLETFIENYVFGVKCRIHVYLKSYGMKD